MSVTNVKGGLISIAARLVMRQCLTELYEVCENQQTISTQKLERIVDRVSEKLRREAICVRNMANALKDK